LDFLSDYVDYELFDFLASLPAQSLIDHSFYTRTILQRFPQ